MLRDRPDPLHISLSQLRDPLNQVRVAYLGLAAIVLALGRPGETAILILLGAATLLPRIFAVPRPFEAAFVAAISLQAVGGVFGLFRPDFGYDILVHFALAGASGCCAYLALVRVGAAPDPTEPRGENHGLGVLLLTAALGMALGSLWEIVEGTADLALGTSLVRGSLDTAVDLIANAIGALAGGAALVSWASSAREGSVLDPGRSGPEAESRTAE